MIDAIGARPTRALDAFSAEATYRRRVQSEAQPLNHFNQKVNTPYESITEREGRSCGTAALLILQTSDLLDGEHGGILVFMEAHTACLAVLLKISRNGFRGVARNCGPAEKLSLWTLHRPGFFEGPLQLCAPTPSKL